jgi:hypothetical protein
LWPKKEESEEFSVLNEISNDEVAFKPFVSPNYKYYIFYLVYQKSNLFWKPHETLALFLCFIKVD